MSKKSTLDRIQISNPCFADWERMVGTEQIRFCSECNKHVYNLSGMTRGEAEALIASAPRGRLCARLTREADGTTVTADAPPGIRLIWRRASPMANAVVSAMLTMATPGIAGGGQFTSAPASIASIIDGPDTRGDTQGAAAALSGTLFDSNEVVIPGATLTLTNEDTGGIQTATSSDAGSFRFFVLTEGVYTLKAESVGFRAVETNGLNLGQGQEQRLNITMEAAQATMGGAMAIPMLTLRELYAESDRIVVARPAGSVKVKSEGESRLIRTSLRVSSTLKGEGGDSVVNVYHFIYGDQETPFPRGESLLVFLKHGGTIGVLKSVGGYELADFSRGIKKLRVQSWMFTCTGSTSLPNSHTSDCLTRRSWLNGWCVAQKTPRRDGRAPSISPQAPPGFERAARRMILTKTRIPLNSPTSRATNPQQRSRPKSPCPSLKNWAIARRLLRCLPQIRRNA